MNQIEKFVDKHFVGKVEKVNNLWVLTTFYPEEKTITLDKSIKKSLKILEDLKPTESKSLRNYKIWDDYQTERNKFVPEPTVFFEIGEKIIYGAWENAVISDIFENGKYYVIDLWSIKTIYREKSTQVRPWLSLEKMESKNTPQISKPSDLYINFTQQNIMSLFRKQYIFGLDSDPDYQRDLIWTLDDKVVLLDSIFNHVEIGKFCFSHKGYKEEKVYELIDGKQRIEALTSFYENKWQYKGLYWKDLHPRDRNFILNYIVLIAEINNATQLEKYEYFLRLNSGGKAVNKDHLEFVKKLYEKELENF